MRYIVTSATLWSQNEIQSLPVIFTIKSPCRLKSRFDFYRMFMLIALV